MSRGGVRPQGFKGRREPRRRATAECTHDPSQARMPRDGRATARRSFLRSAASVLAQLACEWVVCCGCCLCRFLGLVGAAAMLQLFPWAQHRGLYPLSNVRPGRQSWIPATLGGTCRCACTVLAALAALCACVGAAGANGVALVWRALGYIL